MKNSAHVYKIAWSPALNLRESLRGSTPTPARGMRGPLGLGEANASKELRYTINNVISAVGSSHPFRQKSIAPARFTK